MKEKKKLSLPVQLLIAIALGAIAGFVLKENAAYISFIGQIFMRLLKMCVYPLVLISIITGVSNVMDVARLKKIGTSFLLYTLATSTAAALYGAIAMVITKAGVGVNFEGGLSENSGTVNVGESFVQWVPDNVFAALGNGNMVQIIIFAVFFGVMLATIRKTEIGQAVYNVVLGLNEIINKMVGAVIKLAPIGVFALIANMIGTTDLNIVKGIGGYLVAYYGALFVYLLTFLPFVLFFVAKVNPLQFFRNALPAMLMAASTCSSAGTLPVTMRVAKERCGVPEDIVEMITAPAATINMDGAAIEYACYVMFAIHAFNVHMSPLQIIFTIVLCVVMSAGAAGVPGGGIMMCTICLNTMGLPDAQMVAVIAGIYILIDFVGTMLNVTSDTVGMVAIAARVNELDREVFNAAK